MDCVDGPCPHQSVPVEVDERMVPSSLTWPSCQQCIRESVSSRGPVEHEHGGVAEVQFRGLDRPPGDPGHLVGEPWSRQRSFGWPCHYRQPAPWREGSAVHHPRVVFGTSNPPEGQVESLEPPLPLLSVHLPHPVPSPAAYSPCLNPGPVLGRCQCRVPPPQPQQQPLPYCPAVVRNPHQNPRPCLQPRILHANNMPFKNTPFQGTTPVYVAPPREVMHEVSADLSVVPHPRPNSRETRKTVSLPEESRIVFITYSVDAAKDMRPFTTFLTAQGFKPSIDLFDNPIRRMSISKWMDRFLNDKSVLIIVVISPRYKEDVEGDHEDEHGLHTKYIHTQIQSEFIQQGCRNFRLVPVLFPNATKRDVPTWLLNTRIYTWPRDTQDLLLRLLREERYILPQTGGELTLTVRPL
ncbi:E3 ubiquitin ligase TRAF3IP2 [Synchiropus picturatus]